MSNELKFVVKILEYNYKIQISDQNIQLKLILSNTTIDTNHKEIKSSANTNTMNKTRTCIGENEKNEQKQHNTETKSNQCHKEISK